MGEDGGAGRIARDVFSFSLNYPDQKIDLKTFCTEVINDHEALNQEQVGYQELPIFSKVEPHEVLKSYLQVKTDVAMIVQTEIERMLDTPELTDLIIKKA